MEGGVQGGTESEKGKGGRRHRQVTSLAERPGFLNCVAAHLLDSRGRMPQEPEGLWLYEKKGVKQQRGGVGVTGKMPYFRRGKIYYGNGSLLQILV